MVDLGHKRIGFIAAPMGLMFCQLRAAGFRDAMQANGLTMDERLFVHGDLTQRGGFQAAQKLLAAHPRPTAIIACNDLMAIGTMSAARKVGLTIGQELSVGGFDDIPLAEHAHPPLTTVHQPIYEIGQRITKMLIDLIQGEAPAETQVVLTPQLMVRNSSGPLSG
jgi:DNA-binding LacI/PurR family transcriptional regulator